MFTSRHLTILMFAAVLSGGAFAKHDAEDARIRAEVQKRINERPSLQFHNIAVGTVDHVVYLEGLVDTEIDWSQADEIARSVPGVSRVDNELVLNGN
jgi:osmotically-inducible protein OsmY